MKKENKKILDKKIINEIVKIYPKCDIIKASELSAIDLINYIFSQYSYSLWGSNSITRTYVCFSKINYKDKTSLYSQLRGFNKAHINGGPNENN